VSPALSDLPVRKVTGVLESIGFEYVRTKGSHAIRQAGLTTAEFLALL
jgi:predicted RNA binding protein YcfA (HicA-like mRNA interferase family)